MERTERGAERKDQAGARVAQAEPSSKVPADGTSAFEAPFGHWVSEVTVLQDIDASLAVFSLHLKLLKKRLSVI